MNILVACEESQAVTIELRRLGHKAFSCDIIECSGGHPEWHIMQDVLPLLSPDWIHRYSDEPAALGFEFFTMDGRLHFIHGKWDMIIAFPPCTHLAGSGARHFAKKRADGRQRKAVEFFCAFLTADCERIVIENPVGIISGEYIMEHFPEIAAKYGLPRKPDQIVQPWMFGHECTKATCLWLKGVNPLNPTNIVGKGTVHTTEGGNRYTDWMKWFTDENGKAISWNDPRTAKLRSKTFPGLAKAIAEQMCGRC